MEAENKYGISAAKAKEMSLKTSKKIKTIKNIYNDCINPAIEQGKFHCYYYCFNQPDEIIKNYFIKKGFKVYYNDISHYLEINWE